MERGMGKIIRQLLTMQSPEQVAQMTDLPLDVIVEYKIIQSIDEAQKKKPGR